MPAPGLSSLHARRIRSRRARPGPPPPRTVHLERREPLHRVGRRRPHRGRARPRPATAARLLAEEPGLDLRMLHTSVLTRAIRTAELALAAAGRSWLPVRRDWRLNERHYGDLQGKNKAETMARFGEGAAAAVAPELRHPAAPAGRENPEWSSADDPRYRDVAPVGHPARPSAWPTWSRRVLPYWESAIVPDLRQAAETGGAVLVAAHGNSIRALRKHLEGISRRRHRRARGPDRHPLPDAARRRPHGALDRAPWATRRQRRRSRRRGSPSRLAAPAAAPRRGRTGD